MHGETEGALSATSPDLKIAKARAIESRQRARSLARASERASERSSAPVYIILVRTIFHGSFAFLHTFIATGRFCIVAVARHAPPPPPTLILSHSEETVSRARACMFARGRSRAKGAAAVMR